MYSSGKCVFTLVMAESVMSWRPVQSQCRWYVVAPSHFDCDINCPSSSVKWCKDSNLPLPLLPQTPQTRNRVSVTGGTGPCAQLNNDGSSLERTWAHIDAMFSITPSIFLVTPFTAYVYCYSVVPECKFYNYCLFTLVDRSGRAV
jgi:hypothetical protein